METEDWKGLGQAIRAQRKRLGLSQVAVSAAGGPSDETLRRIEQGDPGPYMRRTLTALERVLHWKPGAVQAILAGEDPAQWERQGPSAVELARAPHIETKIRDKTIAALMNYAEVLDSRQSNHPAAPEIRSDIFRLVRRLMDQPASGDE